MSNSAIRRTIGIVCLLACAWLAPAVPVHAGDPVCYDPKTGKVIPCPPTPESPGGGSQPGSAETNGRLCLGAYDDLNFNGAQDAGEPLLGGAQVKVIASATGAVTLADLFASGPTCVFLPGGADYHAEETPPPGFSIVGAGAFDAHLDAGGTVLILFANTIGAPTATATPKPAVKPPTATPTRASTDTATPTPTATTSPATDSPTPAPTPTATASPLASPTASPTNSPAANLAGAPGEAGPGAQPSPPPAPTQPDTPPGPASACLPWLAGAGLGLLTAGLSLAALVLNARRLGRAFWQPSRPYASAPHSSDLQGGLGDQGRDGGPPSPGGDPGGTSSGDGFAYPDSPVQQTTVNPAFTSHTPARPNDRLRTASPGPSGVSGSDYQFSLADLPVRPASRLPAFLGLGILAALVIGGATLGAAGATGAGGSLPCDLGPVGAGLGLGGLAMAVVTGLLVRLIALPSQRYTMFLEDGQPAHASIDSGKLKQAFPSPDTSKAGSTKKSHGVTQTTKAADAGIDNKSVDSK